MFFNKRDKLALRRFLHVESDSSAVTLDVFGRFSRAFLNHPPISPALLTSLYQSRLFDPFATLADVYSHLEVFSHLSFSSSLTFFKGEDPGTSLLTYSQLHLSAGNVSVHCYVMGESGDVCLNRILIDKGSGKLVSELTGQIYENIFELSHDIQQHLISDSLLKSL